MTGAAERFRAARTRPDLAVLEGFHAVKHAMRFGADLPAVIAVDARETDALAAALAPDLRSRLAAALEIVDEATFAACAPHAPRTGVLGLATRPAVDVAAVLADPSPRPAVLLEDPRNLGNLGACVRVAAAAGAAGVLTIAGHDPWHPDALRGAAGLHFALPVARVPELPPPGRPLVAVDPDGDPLDLRALDPRAILAFGSERHGLSRELLTRADATVSIPMRAGVSSLNLATAVAATLFRG